jgi:hypothetical protein
MTLPELIELAKRRLSVAAPASLPWLDDDLNIAAAVAAASHELSEAVMLDRRRPYLQQDYTVTLDGAGSASLLAVTGQTTSAADMLIESIPLGHVRDAYGEELIHLPHYFDFLSPQPIAFSYYTIVGQRIRTRAKGQQVRSVNDVVGVLGPLTVTASFSPITVPAWPATLEDDLTTQLVTVVLRKVKDASA